MNNVEALRKLNERELDLGIAGGPGSWHEKYAHSSVVYVGGLAIGMTEGDVLAVFEQFGVIVHVNLVRDETGKIRGFGFVEYRDQRSTILAVDNFNGVELYGSVLRVDHVDRYKRPDPEKVQILDVAPAEESEHRRDAQSMTTYGGPVPRSNVGQAASQSEDELRKRVVFGRLSALRKRRALEEEASRSDPPKRKRFENERIIDKRREGIDCVVPAGEVADMVSSGRMEHRTVEASGQHKAGNLGDIDGIERKRRKQERKQERERIRNERYERRRSKSRRDHVSPRAS